MGNREKNAVALSYSWLRNLESFPYCDPIPTKNLPCYEPSPYISHFFYYYHNLPSVFSFPPASDFLPKSFLSPLITYFHFLRGFGREEEEDEDEDEEEKATRRRKRRRKFRI